MMAISRLDSSIFGVERLRCFVICLVHPCRFLGSDRRVVCSSTPMWNCWSCVVPGELEYSGKGVSYSAISHAPFFAGKKVAVIGSGPRAVSAVLALTQLSSQVYFIIGQGGNKGKSGAWEMALRHPKVLALFNILFLKSPSYRSAIIGLQAASVHPQPIPIRRLEASSIT